MVGFMQVFGLGRVVSMKLNVAGVESSIRGSYSRMETLEKLGIALCPSHGHLWL